jgi:hypothetical protein
VLRAVYPVVLELWISGDLASRDMILPEPFLRVDEESIGRLESTCLFDLLEMDISAPSAMTVRCLCGHDTHGGMDLCIGHPAL